MNNQNQRRCFWIDPKGQGSYLGRILLLEALVALVSVLLTVFVMLFFILPGSMASASGFWGKILLYVIILCLLLGAGLVRAGIRLSHRIYGPIYRLNLEFSKSGKSKELLREINLRTKDEFKMLVDTINQYFRDLKAREDKKLMTLGALRNDLIALKESQASGSGEKAKRQVERLIANIEKLTGGIK